MNDLWSKFKDWIMSLFIGKDISNNSIMHITDTENTVTQLQGGSLSSTVFHSDLNYLVHDGPYLSTKAAEAEYGVYVSPTVHYYMTHFVQFPESVNTAIANGSGYILVGVDAFGNRELYRGKFYSIFTEEANGSSPRHLVPFTGCYWMLTSGNFINSMKTDYIPEYSKHVSFEVYLINTNLGSFTNPYTPIAQDILLTNTSLTIRGYDFSDIRYVSPQIVNSYDYSCVDGTSSIQFINSNNSNSNSAVVLYTSPSNYLVEVNGTTVASSSLSNSSVFYATTHTTNIIANSYSVGGVAGIDSTSILIASGLGVGDMYTVDIVTGSLAGPLPGQIIPYTANSEYSFYVDLNTILVTSTSYVDYIYVQSLTTDSAGNLYLELYMDNRYAPHGVKYIEALDISVHVFT